MKAEQGWHACFDVYVMGFTSDGAETNLKLMRWVSKNLPANGLFLHHLCAMSFGQTVNEVSS